MGKHAKAFFVDFDLKLLRFDELNMVGCVGAMSFF
jgi:hypothetical protein